VGAPKFVVWPFSGRTGWTLVNPTMLVSWRTFYGIKAKLQHVSSERGCQYNTPPCSGCWQAKSSEDNFNWAVWWMMMHLNAPISHWRRFTTTTTAEAAGIDDKYVTSSTTSLHASSNRCDFSLYLISNAFINNLWPKQPNSQTQQKKRKRKTQIHIGIHDMIGCVAQW